MRNIFLNRITAGVIAASMVMAMTGCTPRSGMDGTSGSGGSAGEETGADDRTEGGGSADEITALDIMTNYNTAAPVAVEDSYRTYYEVFVYSFYDSDGDGIGDIQGLIEKLDYINDGDPDTDTDLGCTGIWLMPVMPSTTYHKYDVVDYCDIDPEYGTMEDFEQLIEECHSRGINVIIDLVMNHSSSQHVWFREASSYLRNLEDGQEPDLAECPYLEYYHFSSEEGSGYCRLSGTDWYYEAQFWGEMPDLNWDSEALHGEFEQIASFWLDKGVDGFRLDAVKEFYTGDTESNIEVLTWFNDYVKSESPDAYIVGEAWNDMNTYARYYESGIDSLFNFAFADSTGRIANTIKNGKASGYGNGIMLLQETIALYSETYIDAPFFVNHDMGRSAGYFPGEWKASQIKMAWAMNLLMSGNTFLYYGEELGMRGSGIDENKRAPMYWSMDENAAGMCDGPAAMESFEMIFESYEEQKEDGDSIYQFVKQVIRLRNTDPVIARGETLFLEEMSGDAVCVLQKTYGGDETVLVFNISKEAQTVSLSELFDEKEYEVFGVLVTSADDITLEDEMLTMPAYSVVIMK